MQRIKNIEDKYKNRIMYKGVLEKCEEVARIDKPRKFRNFRGCHTCGRRLKDIPEGGAIVALYIPKHRAVVHICDVCFNASATDMSFFNKNEGDL